MGPLDLPRKTKLTAPAVAMIRDGWKRASANGWRMKDWCEDCAAMLGVSFGCVAHVVYGNNWRD